MSYPPAPNQSAPYNTNQNYQATSPSNPTPYAQPPAKRQRLSPDVGSPNVSYANGVNRAPGVASGYGNPFAPPGQTPYSPVTHTPTQQYSPNSFNTPNAYAGNRQQWPAQPNQQFAPQRPQNAGSPPSSQMMPPPPRPNREEREEKVGVDDINDALFSSGINLKDEENYMHNMYSNRHSATDSFPSQQGSSFGSTTMSQGNSFNLLTQGTSFGSQQNGVGTIGSALSQDDIEAELTHKRTSAARAKAEYEQHALNRPFLLGNILRNKCKKSAEQQGVRLDQSGVMYDQRAHTQVMMNGDGSNGVVAATIPIKVERHAPFADILGLLSLASGERIRDLLDQSFTLARARRYADQGRVPPDFKDVAVSNGDVETVDIVPEAITGTSWDQLADGAKTDKPESTIAFQSTLNNNLRTMAKNDQDGEKLRLQRREARRKAAEANANGTEDSSLDASADIATAPGTPGADLNAAKITKKELARQQKERANATEAQAATTTNQTAAMMALGRKGNKYSWMSGGAASMPTNRFAKPALATSGSSTGASTPVRKNKADAAEKAAEDANAEANEMVWGAWREDSAGGKGIQLRDWLLVLERDGKEKKAFAQAALKMGILPAKE